MNNANVHNRDTQNSTLKKYKLKCDNDKNVLELVGLVLRRDKIKHLITKHPFLPSDFLRLFQEIKISLLNVYSIF